MIRIVADSYIKPECREEYLELAAKLVEATRQEAGNISYHLHEDLQDPTHMSFIEEWKDEEAIQFHNASPHFTELVPKLGEFRTQPGNVTLYREIL